MKLGQFSNLSFCNNPKKKNITILQVRIVVFRQMHNLVITLT